MPKKFQHSYIKEDATREKLYLLRLKLRDSKEDNKAS